MTAAKEVVGTTDHARLLVGIVDRLAASRGASLAAIVVVGLCCFLPGLRTLPPLDGAETGFAVAARQMVATGNLANTSLQGEAPSVRPLGIYWLEAATAELSGQGARAPFWVYRIPSLLGAIAASLLVWWAAIAFGRPRAALIAACLVAASVVLTMEAHLARADAALLAAITLGEGALARLWLKRDEEPDFRLAFLFWTAVALGVLLKGPIAPVVIFSTIAVLSFEQRSLRWLLRLTPVVGVAWTLVLLIPMALATLTVWIDGAGGGSVDVLAGGPAPVSPLPPGSYLLVLSALFGPGTSFFFLATPWLARHLRQPAILFCIAWAVPFWLLAELFPTKLPHFLLPIFPAIAILTATALDIGEVSIRGRLTWFLSLGPLVVPPLVAIGVPLGFILAEDRVPYLALAPLIVSGILGPAAWLWLRRGEALAAAALSVVSAAFLYLGVLGIALPDLGMLRVSERLVAAGRASVKCADPKFAAAGFAEQSLVFYGGRDLRLLPAAAAADFLNAPGCRVAFVEAHQVSSFRQRAEDVGLEVLDRGKVTGGNLDSSRMVDLRIFAVKDAAE